MKPGPIHDGPAQVITLRDAEGLQLTLLDVGATWWSLRVPMGGPGRDREVLLGGATPDAHLANTAYLGATVGRVANRIAGAQLTHEGRTWHLTPNPGAVHQLHGGAHGYDRRRWSVLGRSADRAVLALHSPAGDQGFPGALDIRLTVRLAGRGVIEQTFDAWSDAATPIVLTNHAYFNLDGRASDVRDHRLRIDASRYAPVDDELIPLGPLHDVQDTPFDFRALRRLRADAAGGDVGPEAGDFDHGLLLDNAGRRDRAPIELLSSDGALRLTMETSMPAMQLYSGCALDAERDRDGRPMSRFAGLALEPEWLPDCVHHPEWPQPACWLQPGERWRQFIRYTFTPTGPAGDGGP